MERRSHCTVTKEGRRELITTDVLPAQQTRRIETMLVLCWASVADGGPTLSQECFNVSCLLGDYFTERTRKAVHTCSKQYID